MSQCSAGHDTRERAGPAKGRFIGLISDTRGITRPEALDALARSYMILHAADVGDPGILGVLRHTATVHAVYGNTDGDELRRILPASRLVELADGASTYVIHILASLDIDPVAVGCTR